MSSYALSFFSLLPMRCPYNMLVIIIPSSIKIRCSHANFLTVPEEAAEFVEKTGVDSLAVAIGTSHGAYKFKDVRLRRW